MTRRIFSKPLANEICRRIADGESLRAICADEKMPNRETVRQWIHKRKGFRDQYTDARKSQADHFIDEIVEIADSDGNPARARVRIEARKWVAAKLSPTLHGEPSAIQFHGTVDVTSRLERARQRLSEVSHDD